MKNTIKPIIKHKHSTDAIIITIINVELSINFGKKKKIKKKYLKINFNHTFSSMFAAVEFDNDVYRNNNNNNNIDKKFQK